MVHTRIHIAKNVLFQVQRPICSKNETRDLVTDNASLLHPPTYYSNCNGLIMVASEPEVSACRLGRQSSLLKARRLLQKKEWRLLSNKLRLVANMSRINLIQKKIAGPPLFFTVTGNPCADLYLSVCHQVLYILF